MTYPTQPSRSGMPPWAKWTMIGCAGCLTLVILGVAGCSAFFYRYFGIRVLDVSDKPDPPLTATAGQLLPTRVGSFVRKRVARFVTQAGNNATAKGWQGSYLSGGRRADLIAMPTAAAQAARARRSPFGTAMRQQNQRPGVGVHMTVRMGPHPMDMVTWSKSNWTFVVQSPDMVAEAFARAYHPGKPASSPTPKARQSR